MKENFFLSKPDWVIVGLGNPGDTYEGTRHNAGLNALKYFGGEFNAKRVRNRGGCRIWSAHLNPNDINVSALLIFPAKYMNNSGVNLRRIVRRWSGIETDRIIVLHDDIEIPAGETQIKKGGGSKGHNGLKSISHHLGSPDYWRIRIGIGSPTDRSELRSYVLIEPSDTEAEVIKQSTQSVFLQVCEIISQTESDQRMSIETGDMTG